MIWPLRLTTLYSSPPASNDITVTPPLEAEWELPSDRMVDILLAAFAFSVMISFLIRPPNQNGVIKR